ncbi:hypothetical protein [Pleurocapsa sp. PCC 7319]|uniref:5'-methylthioadenosine/S-adenosylhomocysteine nucleosidase family protein n=1 Tax=Pleurocapsa sp. PCC 7319 TaxID=118161 RepID=UPI00034B4E40|nr:hypothetical protein [Pleurocapsa sp. PCC 7319]
MNLSIDTIVVPQGAEYQAVRRGIQQTGEQKINVISIPIGMHNIKQNWIQNYLQTTPPRQVLIMGLCGSLSPLYSVGDIVVYQQCWDLNCSTVKTNPELTQMIRRKLSVNLVTGLTSDRPICQAAEKLQLSQTYPVSVVDMEGYAYIQELQHQGISVAMLRVVSDDLAGDIPDLSGAIDSQGNLQALPMAIALLQQPLAAIRLIRGSLTGLKTLQEITIQLLSN